MAEVHAAAQALDLEAVLARLDPDPACRYFIQGQPLNHADLGVFLKNAFSNLTRQEIHWRESSVQVLSPDSVLWTSHGRNPVVDAAGHESEYLLTETWLWKRQADAWRAVHYQETFLEIPSPEKLAPVEAALLDFSATLKIDSRDPQQVIPSLTRLVQTRGDIAGATFTFAPRDGDPLPIAGVFRKGDALVSRQMDPASDAARREAFARSIATGGRTWSDPRFDSSGSGRTTMSCGVPILDPPGILQGVLAVDFALP